MYAEIYTPSIHFTSSGGAVNYEALRIEILASAVDGLVAVKGFDGDVYIKLTTKLDATDKTALDDIIAAHDGLPARTTKSLQEKRTSILDDLVLSAHFHPVLKNFPDEITAYLTYIDDALNAWRRDGNHNILVARIAENAVDVNDPNYTYLNRVVNTDGVKTYEYLIAGIPTTPYI